MYNIHVVILTCMKPSPLTSVGPCKQWVFCHKSHSATKEQSLGLAARLGFTATLCSPTMAVSSILRAQPLKVVREAHHLSLHHSPHTWQCCTIHGGSGGLCHGGIFLSWCTQRAGVHFCQARLGSLFCWSAFTFIVFLHIRQTSGNFMNLSE